MSKPAVCVRMGPCSNNRRRMRNPRTRKKKQIIKIKSIGKTETRNLEPRTENPENRNQNESKRQRQIRYNPTKSSADPTV